MKKIIVILGVFLLLVGCTNNEKDNNDINQSTENNTIVYTLNTTNDDIDMYSKEDIKISVNNTVKIEYTSDKVANIIETIESDYSQATDKYFNEAYQQNKDNFVDVYNEFDGFNMKITKEDKNLVIDGEYELTSIKTSDVKSYLELSLGLAPEKYNDDGTYPLSDLEKALEEKGFTKES